MRLYLRKDIAGMVWDYGAVEGALSGLSLEDPYEARRIELAAASVFGESGSEPGQFSAPRSIAIAADGSLYVADSRNHRIQHLDTAGNVLHVWGTFSDAPQGEGREGTFHEPWSVAVAPDGSVYVADTWNHRIQHFSATGEFIGTFGEFGQGQGSEVLWGPRAIAIDDRGRLFVADTGNKRVAVYDSDENLLTQFGGLEYGFAQLNEPVGLAVVDKKVYVADTWNQRIQVFEEVSEGTFRAVNEWPIDGWYGESLENKPYLAILPEEGLCVTDPEGYRILCFTLEGEYLLSWGEYGVGGGQFGLPSGLVFSPDGNLWVADAGNNRIMQFQPEISSANQSDEIE
jgi:DNA-binding beta-propeller fold protein YncE